MSATNVMDFVEPVLVDYGFQLLDALKRELQALGKGGGALEQSLEALLDGQTMQIMAADYLIYVIRGRQAGGKMPPIEPILEWVKRKGFQAEPRTKRDGTLQTQEEAETSVAWAVAKSIQRDGEPGIDLLSVWEPILQAMTAAIGQACVEWTHASVTEALTNAFNGIPGIEIKINNA